MELLTDRRPPTAAALITSRRRQCVVNNSFSERVLLSLLFVFSLTRVKSPSHFAGRSLARERSVRHIDHFHTAPSMGNSDSSVGAKLK